MTSCRVEHKAYLLRCPRPSSLNVRFIARLTPRDTGRPASRHLWPAWR